MIFITYPFSISGDAGQCWDSSSQVQGEGADPRAAADGGDPGWDCGQEDVSKGECMFRDFCVL